MEERTVKRFWTLWSGQDNERTGSPDFLGAVTHYTDGTLEVSIGDLGPAVALRASVDPDTKWVDDTAHMD